MSAAIPLSDAFPVAVNDDYFPFGGGLRLTGGFVIQNNRFTGSAKFNSNDQINTNGTNYNSSQIGTIESEGKFGNSVAGFNHNILVGAIDVRTDPRLFGKVGDLAVMVEILAGMARLDRSTLPY